jgi:hypothetical protein
MSKMQRITGGQQNLRLEIILYVRTGCRSNNKNCRLQVIPVACECRRPVRTVTDRTVKHTADDGYGNSAK